jgi:hypothetical protein
MSETEAKRQLSARHLILVPAIISLAVTLLRLVGELQHWSKTFFNTEVGGVARSSASRGWGRSSESTLPFG